MNRDQLLEICRSIEISHDVGRAVIDGKEQPLDTSATLRAELTRLVYTVLHAGVDARDSEPEDVYLDDLSDEYSLVDALAAATPHESTTERVAVVHASDERVVVRTDQGVLVATTPDRVDLGGPTAQIRLASTRPGLSPGFFLAKGSRGVAPPGPLLRVYVNIRGPVNVPPVWNTLVGALEDSGAGYHAKVVSDSRSCERRDSMVVYLGPDEDALRRLVAAVEPERMDSSLSPFVAPIGPGLGLAFEPVDTRPKYTGRSFGEHRSACVAAAVSDSVRSGQDVADALDLALSEGNVDPDASWRNRNSPHIELAGLS